MTQRGKSMNKQLLKTLTKVYNHFITYNGNIEDCQNTTYPKSPTKPYLTPKQNSKTYEKTLAKANDKAYNKRVVKQQH